MKKCKGITLMSLIMYISVLFIIIGIMSSIIKNFYQNNTEINDRTQEILEFNKFNIYFLREIKKTGNKIESIKHDEENYIYYILFKTGNSFSLKNGIIYYNNIKICDGVSDLSFNYNSNKENIISAKVTFNNSFSKEITYKIEEIY